MRQIIFLREPSPLIFSMLGANLRGSHHKPSHTQTLCGVSGKDGLQTDNRKTQMSLMVGLVVP
jgi:hypothetical protein